MAAKDRNPFLRKKSRKKEEIANDAKGTIKKIVRKAVEHTGIFCQHAVDQTRGEKSQVMRRARIVQMWPLDEPDSVIENNKVLKLKTLIKHCHSCPIDNISAPCSQTVGHTDQIIINLDSDNSYLV